MNTCPFCDSENITDPYWCYGWDGEWKGQAIRLGRVCNDCRERWAVENEQAIRDAWKPKRIEIWIIQQNY